jgi:predicted PurR-regulated permease PerM
MDKILENLDFGLFSGLVFFVVLWSLFKGFPSLMDYLKEKNKLDRELALKLKQEENDNLKLLQSRDDNLQLGIDDIKSNFNKLEGQITQLTLNFNDLNKVVSEDITLLKLSIKDLKEQNGLNKRSYD